MQLKKGYKHLARRKREMACGPSTEGTLQTVEFYHWDRPVISRQGQHGPTAVQEARHLHSNRVCPKILHQSFEKQWQNETTTRYESDENPFERRWQYINDVRTSSVSESNGSFHAGFRWLTLLERSVRLRYLGLRSGGYCEIPLSTASIASMNSSIAVV